MQDNDLQDTLYEAANHLQSGRLEQAEELYLRVLGSQPSNPHANHNLGVLAMQTGKGIEVALPRFRKAWQTDPAHQQHWLSYIRALVQAGDQATAQQVYAHGRKRGLQGPDPQTLKSAKPAGPNRAEARQTADRGTDIERKYRDIIKFIGKGKLPAAERKARTLTQKHPRHPASWKALGLVLRKQARNEEATKALGTSAQLASQSSTIDPETWFAFGELTYQNGSYREAEVAMKRVLSVAPENTRAITVLARALLKQYRPSDAEPVCRAGLKYEPESAIFHRLLGDALQPQQRDEEAMESYRRALAADARNTRAYRALGAMLFERQRHEEILALCRATIAAAPDFFFAYSDYGTTLQRIGRIDEAMAAYGQALALRPDDLGIRCNWLFCCNYLAAMPARDSYAEAVAFGKHAAEQARPFTSWACDNSPKRLRVGIVSGDLREHPVGYFLENVLAHSDRSRIEWFAYSTHTAMDMLSERLQQLADRWTFLTHMSTEDCARQIHDDGVHLLLDLSGHSAHNLLPAFAWRPAPVQASWLGYFATTGLVEMDYFIADPVSVPTSGQDYFTEAVWYLPETRLCFTPPDNAPQVSATPALARGHVTFGCFQKLAKISDDTLRRWAQILQACSGSRLRVQARGLDNEANRQAFIERAQQLGITAERLELCGSSERRDYLAQHAEVDILLDTFPFTGGTTTCEALWMGVPTVTLAGSRLVSRQGAALLTAAGLQDWVAESPADYVQLAIDKARDPAALNTLRLGLREKVNASALFDGERFANHLTDALWGMWHARH